jgi:hypothetical protein
MTSFLFSPARTLSLSPHAEIFSSPPLQKPSNPKPKVKGISQRCKPEKIPNPYFIFCANRRGELQAENPGLPSREVTKILAREWAQLSAADKAEYSVRYQQRLDGAEEERLFESNVGKDRVLLRIPLPDGGVLAVPAFFRGGSGK